MDEQEKIELRDLQQLLVRSVDRISRFIGDVGDTAKGGEEYKKLLYEERRHLEGLLKDRINFLLVFSSVLLLAVYRTDMTSILKGYFLVAGSLVSIFMALAILRTHRLVMWLLKEIRTKYKDDPYPILCHTIKFPGNANRFLVFLPIVLTLLFIILTANEFGYSLLAVCDGTTLLQFGS